MELEELKVKMVEASRRLWDRGLVANHDGNISFKISTDKFLITPSAFSKKDISEDDLLLVSGEGKVLDGPHKVFGEFAWHLAVYKVRPDVTCVVHAHPATAMGFGLSGVEIGTPAIPEAIVSLGAAIHNLKFYSPLDVSLGAVNSEFEKDLSRVLNDSDSFVAPGNGAWTVGQTIDQTYLRLELVEQVAKAHLVARQLGSIKALPRTLVEELLKKRFKAAFVAPLIAAPKTALELSALDIRGLVQKEIEKIFAEKNS